MKKVIGSLRLKVLILAVLVGLTFQMSWSGNEIEACERCVPLTGGLCVGCADDPSGSPRCTPIQESCDCSVSAGSCNSDN
jgi:hypothetical protein